MISEAVFACYTKACAPPPVGKGGSGKGLSDRHQSMLDTALKNGHVGASQRDAQALVKAGLLQRSSGKGKGLGNTPVWEPTAAAKVGRETASGPKVQYGGKTHNIVGETDTHYRVQKDNGEVFRIPKSIARLVEQDFPVITKAEARGDSRPVSHAEFQRLARKGQAQLDKMAADASPTTGLDKNWSKIKAETFAEVQKSWGGATIDAHTGKALPQGANAYAITVKPKGISTVSVPEGASATEFAAAMDKARKVFGSVLERRDHHLGVFHDDETGRIDIDPVLVVTKRSDVDTIGAASRSIGGAYNFADGNGYWPPHVV